jgi:hypothetical protein
MEEQYRDFFKQVEPIKLKEPLAETLGAFKVGEPFLEYSFGDAVKMAGHACPTVAGAYLICQQALKKLYQGEIPVRGEISITVFGEPDEGVYGVVGQVFTFLTGAAPLSGFRGLGHRFRRKNLLVFQPEKIDERAMAFKFKRLDKDQSVLVKFYPQLVPFSVKKAERLQELLEKVVWEAAREEEKQEFRNLWMEKVKAMVMERKGINNWLKLEEKENNT